MLEEDGVIGMVIPEGFHPQEDGVIGMVTPEGFHPQASRPTALSRQLFRKVCTTTETGHERGDFVD